jgi:hypothetical protein
MQIHSGANPKQLSQQFPQIVPRQAWDKPDALAGIADRETLGGAG